MEGTRKIITRTPTGQPSAVEADMHAGVYNGGRSAVALKRVDPATTQPSINRPRLRLVDDPTPYHEELCFSGNAAQRAHSLHELDIGRSTISILAAQAVIERFSKPGEVVLDPAARYGVAVFEALVTGRKVIAAETDALESCTLNAKLLPADIAEVALGLQSISLRRPVDLTDYRDIFSHYFDVDTYREILSFRQQVLPRTDKVGQFLTALALGVLHGPSAGYLSVATPFAEALSVEEQRQLNIQRRQRADHRALLPRMLKRAAAVMRDGLPPTTRGLKPQVLAADPRRLESVEQGSVDLLITEIPFGGEARAGTLSWLRSWFAGLPQVTPNRVALGGAYWSGYMNEALLEWSRVLKPGKRAILGIRESNESPVAIEALSQLVRNELSRFWVLEGTVSDHPPADVIRGRTNTSQVSSKPLHLLILRRR